MLHLVHYSLKRPERLAALMRHALWECLIFIGFCAVAQKSDYPENVVLCKVDGKEVTWSDLTGTSHANARKLADSWESMVRNSTRDWWNSRGGVLPSGPPKQVTPSEPLLQRVLDSVCQGLVDLVFLESVFESVKETNASAKDQAYLADLDKNMRDYVNCMYTLDTAFRAIANGKEAGVVWRESKQLTEWFPENKWTKIASIDRALIRAFRQEAFPLMLSTNNKLSPWMLLDYNRYSLHRMVVEMAIADQQRFAQMVVQQYSFVSAVAIEVANALELAEFKKILDQTVDYEKGTVIHSGLERGIRESIALGFNGRISLIDRQFPEDLEAKFPCDFTTSPAGVPLHAGQGEDGRQRYCFILARESILDKPLEELTVKNSNWVRNKGVRETLRPHVEKVAETFKPMAPWRTPDLDRVHQMVSALPPSRIGTKELPRVTMP